MSKRRINEDYNYTCRIGLWCFICLLFLLFLGNIKRTEPREIISPVPVLEAKEIPKEVLPTPTPILSEKELILKEIKDVFGEHSEEAMRILTDPECHENLYLDPKAVNDNQVWGGVGVDKGLYQINSFYHPEVSDECAFNYKCNIAYAYKLFKARGDFSAWTCGKVLGL